MEMPSVNLLDFPFSPCGTSPSPLVGEGAPKGRMRGIYKYIQRFKSASPSPLPPHPSLRDTFSHKGRRGRSTLMLEPNRGDLHLLLTH
jgi:hypothetical protein